MISRVQILAFLGLLLSISSAQENNVPLAGPPSPWYIETPTFNSSRLDLFLEYPVSDYIPYENLGFTLYDSNLCGSGANVITENNYLAVGMFHDDQTTTGEGNAFRNVTLSFRFDPETIRESPIIHFEGLETNLKFCVRLSAYTADIINPGGVEIYYKETFMTVDISQAGDIDGDQFVVDPENIGNENAEQKYYLIGYLCNRTNDRLYDPAPIFQGMPTRVCVTPNEEALNDGVYMRAIDSFYWTRETLYQTAIIPHQTAAPLTLIECEPGMTVCAFTTLLRASFFYKRGRVDGAGIGWLQFGRGGYVGESRRAQIVLFEGEDTSPGFPDFGVGSLPTTRQVDEGAEPDEVAEPEGPGTDGFAGQGPFQVDIPVTRLYNAIGYLCDADNNELDPLKNPLVEGDTARVCVTPNDIALIDNVRIRAIDSFTWVREEFDLSQTAIISHAEAAPASEIFCIRGSLVCAFETVLEDGFYGTPGIVNGEGMIWLQFGDESRLLQFDLGSRRRLQYGNETAKFDYGFGLLADMLPGFAGATPFSAYVYVMPPLDQRELYRCRAYECDYTNREIVTTEAKVQGDSIRICVEPSYAAQEAGAKMWSIEWWTWEQVNVNQTAIVPQGKEAPDGKTVIMCYRGMEVCFFQTRLKDEFFQIPNGINGDGYCWLTYGGLVIPGLIETETDGGVVEEEEINASRDPLYAGSNEIGMTFPVTGSYVIPPLTCPPEVHSLKLWWEEEDDNLRLLYILTMVGAGAGLCCLFGLCLCCNRKEDKKEEYNDGNIIVNVEVEDHHNTENHTEKHVSEHVEEKKEYSEMNSTKYSDDPERGDRKSKSSSSTDLLGLEATPFNGKPSGKDVCFGDEDHPGTIDCRKAVQKYMKDNPDQAYGPNVFSTIKKRMKERFFLVRDDRKAPWREAKKREVISTIGEMWREQKRKTKS